MRLLTFRTSDDSPLRLGVDTPGGVIDVASASEALRLEVETTPDAFFARGSEALPSLERLVAAASRQVGSPAPNWLLDRASVAFGPCVPTPGKIICVGLNYLRHARESGMAPPETPVLFSKFGNSIAASGDDVPLPPGSSEVDYEAELVAVIGRRARAVSESDALGHVLGYCNGNDLSARDLQMLTGQWLIGKTLDRFLPIGPYLVTADEAGDPQALSVRCRLNGEARQDSTTADMIFSVAKVISYVSGYLTLEPGDLISTGTPEGVILGRSDKQWLAPGDVVEVEVGNLGVLENRMIGARE